MRAQAKTRTERFEMRLRAEERKLIERLKAKLHLESSALIRLALIRLAEAENVLHK